MKRTILELGAVALALFVMLSVWNYRSVPLYDREEQNFICVINPGYYYWDDIKNGLEQAGVEFGVHTEIVTFERFDIEKQVELLKKAAYMKADGIITLGEPNHSVLNETIQKIMNAGIPVVLIDSDSEESGRSCYVGTDNYEAGRLAAQKLAAETGENASVMAVLSQMDAANQKERLEGFQKELENYGDMELTVVVEGEADKETLRNKVQEALVSFQQVDAIYCAEGYAGLQVGTLLEEDLEKHQGLVLVGFELSDALLRFFREGLWTGTLVQDGYGIGYEAVKQLAQYVQGKKKTPEKVSLPLTYVTKETVEEYAYDYFRWSDGEGREDGK